MTYLPHENVVLKISYVSVLSIYVNPYVKLYLCKICKKSLE